MLMNKTRRCCRSTTTWMTTRPYASARCSPRSGHSTRRPPKRPLQAELNYWWRHRAIPPRAQIKRLLENLQLESTLVLAEKSFGLSLSDRYWLNDEDDPTSWGAVNFFDNDFSVTWDFSPWART
ncbi:MAG: hypothetical protein ACLTMP_09455 [Eggerthella lenta]